MNKRSPKTYKNILSSSKVTIVKEEEFNNREWAKNWIKFRCNRCYQTWRPVDFSVRYQEYLRIKALKEQRKQKGEQEKNHSQRSWIKCLKKNQIGRIIKNPIREIKWNQHPSPYTRRKSQGLRTNNPGLNERRPAYSWVSRRWNYFSFVVSQGGGHFASTTHGSGCKELRFSENNRQQNTGSSIERNANIGGKCIESPTGFNVLFFLFFWE